MEPEVAAFRPLGVTDLIDETFRIYRANFALIIGIAAVLLVPFGFIEILQRVALERNSGDVGMNLLVSAIVDLLNVLVFLGVLSAVIFAISEIRLGRKPTISQAYNHGMDHLPAMIGVGFFYALVVGLVSITIVGIPFGIYLGVSWSFGMHVAVLEGMRGFPALTRSRDLVKDNWWRVLGITVLVSIMVSIISLIFSIPGLIVGVSTFLSHSDQSIGAPALAIAVISSTAGSIITGPIIYIASVLLYYDLRARKEGLDLEIMAGRAEAAARSSSF